MADRSLRISLLVLLVFFFSFPISLILSQPLSLPSLPYSYPSLSPVLSERSLRLHHLQHHQAYTTKLNEALIQLRQLGGTQKELAKLGIDIILTRLEEIEDGALRNQIRNQGGGFVNHQLFFSILQPLNYTATNEAGAQPTATGVDSSSSSSASSSSDGSSVSSTALSVPVVDLSSLPSPSAHPPSPSPSSPFSLSLVRSFGSFASFQSSFTSSALSLFGSGWVWLYVDGGVGAAAELKIGVTQNQDYIGSGRSGHIGVLILDVWEHAYYVDYENRRDEYVKQWWWIVNWKKVEELFDHVIEIRNSKEHGIVASEQHRQDEL